MFNLNLLPGEEKKNIYFEELRRFTLFLAASSLIILAVFSVLLLLMYFKTNKEKQEIFRATSFLGSNQKVSDTPTVEKEVTNFNKLFRRVIVSDQTKQGPSQIWEELINSSGSRIRFNALSYKKMREVNISGFAPFRQDLISFEEKLKTSSFLQNITSPLSNIVKETNINFNIRATPTF